MRIWIRKHVEMKRGAGLTGEVKISEWMRNAKSEYERRCDLN